MNIFADDQPRYYKYRSLDNLDYLADILVNQRLFCAPFHALNDPMEGLFHITDDHMKNFSVEVKDKTPMRICSLSSASSIGEILLWAHYANSHKGVAVEFLPRNQVRNVIYVENLPTEELWPGGGILVSNDRYMYKLNKWRYEEEYRYITTDPDDIYLNGTVSKVIFGISTPDHVKGFIRDFCSTRNIKTANAKLDRVNYKIWIEED